MSSLRVPVTDRDHAQGPTSAELSLVEYGDYQCPHCGAAHRVLKLMQKRFGPSLRFAYRHFPLAELHPMAIPAAMMAEAAGSQGRFWDMHDLLFEHQDHLDMPHMIQLAGRLELELDQIRDELESDVHLLRIREDFLGGMRSGVAGTPSLYINGERYDGARDPASLTHALDRARRPSAPSEMR